MEAFKIPYTQEVNDVVEDIKNTFYNPDSPTGRPNDEQALSAAKQMMNLRHDLFEQGENDE